jgi:Ser/Thr protein kinase RdoA (MazF antagonist)
VPQTPVQQILAHWGIRPRHVLPLKVVDAGNSSWRVETEDGRVMVLRRYHERATVADVSYEHAVLAHLAQRGWIVPAAVGSPHEVDGAIYSVTRFVPGASVDVESVEQQRRRGRDLAHLHLALRDLDLGQRPGWRPQHTATTVHADIDWETCVQSLRSIDGSLADWAQVAAKSTANELVAVGAADLQLAVIHGDFTSWNVHYDDNGQLAGVIDFGLTHLDTRPYELAIARTYRAPEMITSYRAELQQLGWPLTPLEEAVIEPMQRAFRVDMAAWFIDSGRRTGSFDLDMIRRQLARTGTRPPS